MGAKVNYTLVGLFVLILGAALLLVGWWLSFDPDDTGYHEYLMFFNESVSSLSLKAPVKFNGVDVGYVKNIQLNPHNLSQVKLLVSIEEDIPINTSIRAMVQLQGITGIAYIGLKVGDPKAPLLNVEKPYHYPVIPTEPSLLFRLDTAIREITNNIGLLTKGITTLFDKENVAAIHQSLHHTEKLTALLAANTASMQRTIQNGEIVTANLKEASEKLPEIMLQFSELSHHLKQVAQQGDTALQTFSEQAIPVTLQGLDQLQHVLASTQRLLQKMDNNPAVLVRGETPSTRGPGE